MVFLDYQRLYDRFLSSQEGYNALLDEKEALFIMTQPKAVDFEKDRVQNNTPHDTFASYLIRKEKSHIEERIEEARALMVEREALLKLKHRELYESRDKLDRVYRFRFIDNMTVKRIARYMHYSKAQVYRMIETIQGEIKNMRKNENEIGV